MEKNKTKILVDLEVSIINAQAEFNIQDLGYTIEQWNLLPKEQKLNIIQMAVNNLSEQPYWVINSIKQII